jgi:predicted GTPase
MRRRRRVLVAGAAGRDFHDFNVAFRAREDTEVVAFTATQIPNIAGRRYPPALSGARYPAGIPIHPEEELEELVQSEGVDEVVFSYSDVTHEHVMHVASRALAAGAGFRLLAPAETQLVSTKPVVSVCAVRTGSGKSQTARHVAGLLRDAGRRVAVLRHPMPYGDLARQAVQRFERYEDLEAADCTIEEREEYEPHLAAGNVVFAGIDYAAIVQAAEAEADVIVWEGGNNDTPFVTPTLHIVVVDPHRAGHERRYHPGELNLRLADVCVVNKVDSAPRGGVDAVVASIRELNPKAEIVLAASPFEVEENGTKIAGKRVLAVEDGPTLTHGEMAYGVAVLAAREHGAEELVDPRPFAVGSIAQTFHANPHLADLLPAMGYGRRQIEELRETIARSDAELVLVGTPVDLRRMIELDKPALRVSYKLQEIGEPTLADILLQHGLIGETVLV